MIGTISNEVLDPIASTVDPETGNIRFTGTTSQTFDGRLQVDALSVTTGGVYPSLILAPLNDQIDVEVAAQVDNHIDLTLNTNSGEFLAKPGMSFDVKSLTTKSIGVSIDDDNFDFGDGTTGRLRLSAIDPTDIENNATALAGTFSTTDGKIVFGRITGNATLVAEPGATTLALENSEHQFVSPFALSMDVQTEVLTQLDENGLVTPTVTVTDGIEMNGSRITGLAAGEEAGDAVNLGQLQNEASARIAGDLALKTRLDGLQSRVDKLDAKIASSTAVAVAMGGATFLPGMKFNLSGNIATYDGAHAGSLQFGALLSKHVAVNGGVATGFNRGGKTAGRVGFTFGW
ncbi:hypothetical protein [Novosphingobium percolationis]|uniref:hypothetical protein n=1 Tax=Novosphingobium percolationis TaxID=2871811 RepID=UPI001CD76413|nr:hypothetical protein [Novosphingobium percolationis]